MGEPIRVIALDLDGTLAVDDHDVSARTAEALHDVVTEGIHVAIATGRRFRTTSWVLDNLGLPLYSVCNGGALIKRPDRSTHHRVTFSEAQLADLITTARQMQIALFGQRDSHADGGPDMVVDDETPWDIATARYVENNRDWSGAEDLTTSSYEFLLLGGFGTQAHLHAYRDAIERRHPGRYNLTVVPFKDSDDWYCEINQSHVSKWSGLCELARLLDITPASQICAVGDQLNDLSMILGSDHGVAMGNGHPELKEHAAFVCGHNDADGILDVVDYVRRHNAKHR